jgi:PAS domain S-box-containing protein
VNITKKKNGEKAVYLDELQKLQLALKKSENDYKKLMNTVTLINQKLNFIIKNVSEVIYILDTDGNITFISDDVKRYGFDAKELFGSSIMDIVHPEDRIKAIYRINERRKGIRRTFQLGEFIITDEGEKVSVQPNVVYRWKPSTDKMVQHNSSTRLFEDLSRHTGMNLSEINKDLETKKKILDYLVKNKIRDLNNVGKVTAQYYLDPDFVIKNITKKANPKKILDY